VLEEVGAASLERRIGFHDKTRHFIIVPNVEVPVARSQSLLFLLGVLAESIIPDVILCQDVDVERHVVLCPSKEGVNDCRRPSKPHLVVRVRWYER